MPRATSSAKLGPDRIAGVARGKVSAITSVMKRCVPRSIPLAQATTGTAFTWAPSAAAAARRSCAGTASSTASACATSAIAPVAATRRSISTPGRRGLSRRLVSIATTAASRAQSVTSRPARAAAFASAVPHAPAPITAMRWSAISEPPAASAPRRRRAASARGAKHRACRSCRARGARSRSTRSSRRCRCTAVAAARPARCLRRWRRD